MSIAPAETVLERTDEAAPRIRPTAHWWHSGCQGTGPGPKVCYCGARITTTGRAESWTGKIETEDCVVCVDLVAARLCPLCGANRDDRNGDGDG